MVRSVRILIEFHMVHFMLDLIMHIIVNFKLHLIADMQKVVNLVILKKEYIVQKHVSCHFIFID